MNTNTHPIEFFLACLINLVEFICYMINHIAGHHQGQGQTNNDKSVSRDQTITTTASSRAVAVNPIKPHISQLFTTLQSLTVKQLQVTTGIKSSRYRKTDLMEIAAAY